MTGLELALKIKEAEYELSNGGYLIVNGATAHEFMAKWNELKAKHHDNATIWSNIVMLFDLEFHPDTEQDIK